MRSVILAARVVVLLLAAAGSPLTLAATLQPFDVQLDKPCAVELEWQAPVGHFQADCEWLGPKSRLVQGRTYQLNAILSPANTRLENPAEELKNALADIFEKPEEAAQADCHLMSMFGTVCRNVPKGALIRKRTTASDAFSATTGYVICLDNVAGRGPCVPMKPK